MNQPDRNKDIQANYWDTRKAGQFNSYFASLMEVGSEALIALDAQHRVVGWNASAERIYGWNAKEVIGKPLNDFLKTEPVENSIEQSQPWQEEAWSGEVTQLHKDGARLPIWLSVSRVTDGSGDLIGYIGIHRDMRPQKRANAELRASQSMLAATEEVAHIGSWTWDLHTQKVTWSDEMFRLFGVERHDFDGDLNRIIAERIHPDDAAAVQESNRSVLEQGTPRPLSYRIVLPDGRERTLWAQGRLVRDESGQPVALTGFVQDISERVRTEKRVTRMKRLYATLSQVNQTIVRVTNHNDLFQSICDLSLQFGEFALAWIGMLDESTGNVRPVAAAGLDVDHWPFPIPNLHEGEFANGLIATAVRSGRVTTSENLQADTRSHILQEAAERYNFQSMAAVPIKLKGTLIGTLMLVSQEVGLFKNRDEVLLLDEMGLDISFALDNMEKEAERQRAEEQLRESEERYKLLFESNPHPMWVYDLETLQFLMVNDAAIKHYGYSREEFLRMTILDIRPPEDHQRVLENVAAVTEGIDEAGSWRHKKKDGRLIDVEITSHTLDFDGRKAEVVLAHDITERKLADEKLRSGERTLQLFVEYAPAAIAMLDRNMHYIAASQRYLSDYKLGDQKLEGRSHYEVFPEIPKRWKEIHQRCLAGATEKNEEDPFLRADGRTDWVRWEIHPWYDDTGKVGGIILFSEVITERKQSEQQIQLQLKRISALSEIDRAISSSLDMRLSLDLLLDQVLSQLNVDAASVLLLNETRQTLDYFIGKGYRNLSIRQTRLHLREGLAGQVGAERKLLHIPSLDKAERHYVRAAMLKEEKFVEYFGVPLVAKGSLKGVLEIFNRSALHPGAEWVNYLETLAGQAAIAIDNAQLFEGMQQSNQELISAYDATIAGWSRAMDLRDKETEGHTQRVTELTVQLALKMGFSPQEILHLRRGTLLHDIGKLGVPDNILFKPDELTAEEWDIMRQHPIYAFNMLIPISYLRPALDIPYCHHERWDGSGYPRGLKGEQIPLAARLFAVVDVWDALRSDRPYRSGWSTKQARQYLLEQSGKLFDPRVVETFLGMIESE